MLLLHVLHFFIVVASQLVFFYIHARAVGEMSNFAKYLVQGALLGLPFGLVFDLLVGKYLGVFTYEIGFPLWFLAVNGLLSYGLMMANVLLLFRHSVIHMYVWSFALGATYEAVNYLFPVWHWNFLHSAVLEYVIVLGAAYAGLTWLMMISLRAAYSVRFKLVPF